MDPNRFDALTRRYATGTTRRGAIRGLAGGGLLAAFGFRGASSASLVAAATTCTWSWTGNVRLGPDTGVLLVPGASQPGELKGTLSLALGDDGAIDQGQLVLADGTTMAVVGQAAGRAVNLRLQGGNGRILIAVGTGEQAITTCAGKIDGPLTGPQLGDLGEWHAVANGANGGSGGTTSGAAPSSSGGAAPNANTGANPTVSATSGADGGGGNTCASGVVCGGVCCQPAPGLTPDSITCNAGVCECSYSCAAAGCGGGTGTIVNTCGSDPQPHCHSECNVPAGNGCGDMTCPDGQTLDVDTCTCQSNGGGGDTCGGADLLHDANNCGFCGVVCGSGFCQNGVCADSDPCVQTGRTNCNSQCFDTQNDPENCGGCGIHCPSGECIEGNCTEVIH